MKDMDKVYALKMLAAAMAVPAAKCKTARQKIEVGTHAVDCNVHITGTLTVCEDEEYTPTASIPLKAALALFVRYSGATRDAAIKAMERAMIEALRSAESESGLPSDDIVMSEISDDIRVVDECMARVEALARALPKKSRDGKVLSKLEMSIV